MSRSYNFCAGPAALPEPVLEIARDDMLNWHGCGLSFMEMSHRSAEVVGVAEHAERTLRKLLSITDDYAVLFLQGGASTQFSAVPLNLLGNSAGADYVNTGQWSKKAIAEARRFGAVNVVASSEETQFSSIPDPQSWQLDSEAAYLHYTPNETIGGVEFGWVPQVSVPLVGDMSSTILSRPMAVEEYGVIYAGAQKNIGPAGLTLVIVRRDLLGKAHALCPAMLNWQTADENDSMYNTPPTFAVYTVGLVAKWLLDDVGGLEAMAQINRSKADLLYDLIDESDGFYRGHARRDCRSVMNVTFRLPSDELEAEFVADAAQQGLTTLKGHRSVGGIRASIYNAMPVAGVEKLRDHMRAFAGRHAK